jgi:predicted ATPase
MLLATGRFCLASSTWHLGMIRQAREHWEAASQIAGESGRGRPVFHLGPELGIFCQSYMAHVLWLTGEPHDLLDRSRQTVARAESLSHPFSLATALAYAAMLHQFRDEPELARDRAEAAAAVCRRYGFRYYLAWTPIIAGWAQARLGDPQAGLAEMLQGFKDLRATGAALRAPYYLTLIAQVCGHCGEVARGLRYLEEGAALAEASGEKWLLPEWQRTRGELLRQAGQQNQAETCYRSALRLARQMGAHGWELRAEASLNQLAPAEAHAQGR